MVLLSAFCFSSVCASCRPFPTRRSSDLLRLAASLGLGLKVVVFCDNSLNRIELKQMARQYPSTGTVIEDTDIVKMAESMACNGVMVENEQDLADALATPMTTTPLVIGARIDPKQYWTQF